MKGKMKVKMGIDLLMTILLLLLMAYQVTEKRFTNGLERECWCCFCSITS